MMGGKEPNYAETQRASYSGCHPGPAVGGGRSEDGLRSERTSRRPEKGARGTSPECRDGSSSRPRGDGNNRNGYGRKSVITDTGKLDLQIPRDRQASFD